MPSIPNIPVRRLALAVCVVLPGRPGWAHAQGGFAPDVLPRAATSLSFDSQLYRGRRRTDDWWWALPGAAVGLGHGVDLGVRMSLFEPRTGTAYRDLAPQLRWRAWSTRSGRVRGGASLIAVVPLNERSTRSARGYAIATAAWSDSARRTTLTLGAWQSVQHASLADHRHGAVAELSRVLGRRRVTTVSATWFAGQTLFGFLTVGATRSLARHTLFAGWAQGNAPQGNRGPSVSWSWVP